MGFNFRGLTSTALVSAASEKNIKDVSPDRRASVGTEIPNEKGVVNDMNASLGSIDNTSDDSIELERKIDPTAQRGVQMQQAMTLVWSRRDLIIAYLMMWLIEFVLNFASACVGTLTPYVTSSFQEHSLTALTGVISSLIAGLWKLPYVKIMNVWGRPQALAIGVLSCTLGIIMMAGCNNVKTYCAAQVFFYLGFNSVDFSMTVFIADTSKLKNRGLMIGYVSSPWLITTWVYGFAVNSIVKPGGIGYRWGFGVFAIFVPLVAAPFIWLLWTNENKAVKQGLVPAREHRRTFIENVKYYAKEFDVIGILILALGLALFLLAFNIYSYQANTWKSPLIICFLIFGALFIIAFGLYEKYLAPVTFIPWYLLKNRTVIFTYTMAAALYTGWYIWNSYFYSCLIVLYNQPIVYATYINNTYTMGSCLSCLIYGVCLRYYGKLKIYSLFWGAPLTILGVGLMIAFREPGSNIGYVEMCLIFIAFGGGVLVVSEQTTLMAVSKQQDFPALLAVESMVISIGGAIGSTIAGAMWTGIFPVKLAKNLPADAQPSLMEIYGDLTVQSGYAWGTPTRDAINLSYSETQRLMLVAATCVYFLVLVSVVGWQNVDVRKQKQRTFGLL